jgi:hypothetical protein
MRWLQGVLYLLAAALLVFVFVEGRGFYLAPLSERAHHPGYWRFKPGGSWGHPLGIAGSTMLTLLLLYSVRKRVGALRRFGALSRWLDVHIFLGVVGPLLVVLHSSFKVQGLVALSFWSMIAVALSGVLGRYLYLQIPRSRAGDELSLEQIRAQDAALARRLETEFGLGRARIEELERLTLPHPGRGTWSALLAVLASDLRLRSRLAAFARGCPEVPARELKPFLALARQKAVVRRRIELWDALRALFHHWHVVHKPFAVVMYLFMALHIAVASWTGYAWGR